MRQLYEPRAQMFESFPRCRKISTRVGALAQSRGQGRAFERRLRRF
jgi:hypothetical protein